MFAADSSHLVDCLVVRGLGREREEKKKMPFDPRVVGGYLVTGKNEVISRFTDYSLLFLSFLSGASGGGSEETKQKSF